MDRARVGAFAAARSGHAVPEQPHREMKEVGLEALQVVSPTPTVLSASYLMTGHVQID
jgi:hypothetical protein